MWFKAKQDVGPLLFSYDPSKKQCLTHFDGPGYEQVARVTREVATKTTFTRLTGGEKDGAKADVLEGPIPSDGTKIARVIIIENYKLASAAISYGERTK